MDATEQKRLEDAVETLIDKHGMSVVLETIEAICHGKAQHLDENWQDREGSRCWTRMAKAIDKAIHVACVLP